ncbi:hypothetical protein MNBD_UNCLBAC01-76 [hydrothermal vent metagenome]|uniref:Lipoprotein n=1 Tax=hydrothermal vent metagenome TaxID=652676 RepID=A0A3B1DCF5_9ZZZZ
MRKCLLVLCLFFLGCASAMVERIEQVSQSYDNVVFDDAISWEEAKIMAQKELIDKNFVEIYDLKNPYAERKVEYKDLPHYQDHWLVFFKERERRSIPSVFTVIIHKETGRIKFADDYAKESLWMLEAALLK